MDPRTSRIMRLGAYVELPLAEVIERLNGPAVDELLADVVNATYGDRPDRIELHAVAPEQFTDHAARMPFTWRAVDGNGRAIDGAGDVQLFVVQSGCHPTTELIATFGVTDDDAPSVAAEAHRMLDELAARLVGGVVGVS